MAWGIREIVRQLSNLAVDRFSWMVIKTYVAQYTGHFSSFLIFYYICPTATFYIVFVLFVAGNLFNFKDFWAFSMLL